MQSRHLPPMSGGSGKDEVICIEAKRICDFCFQEHQVERTFASTVGAGFTADCEIVEEGVTCREVNRRTIDDKKDEKELVCIAVTVPVIIRIFDAAGNLVQTLNQTITFLKQAVLCAPSGTDIDCQITGECCCFVDVDAGNILCTFDFCVVIQTIVIVRVLVPTLGPCAPKECRSTVLGCPPKVPDACKHCDC